jgi:hypothetical protein
MPTLFEEETDEISTARFDAETAEVDTPIEPEARPPMDDSQTASVEAFPLETLITPTLCGLLLSLPGSIRARQTGREYWLLSDEEKDLLGQASQPLFVYLVRKYLGEGVGMFTATAVAMTAVYAPRLIRDQQEQRKNKGQGGPVPIRPRPASAAGSQPSSASEAAVNPLNSDSFSVPFQE